MIPARSIIRPIPWLVGLVTLAIAPAGSLAAPRYTKSEIRIKAKQSKLKAIKREKAKPKKRERRRPEVSAAAFRRVSMRKALSRLNDEAIRKLKQLIKITEDDDPDKPDYFFRLAEHYRERKVDYEFRARELDDPIFDEKDPTRKERLKRIQKKWEEGSRRWMIASIKMYLRIATTRAYSSYARMDEVLFNVADMLNQAGRRDKARIFFSKLIRNYPQSKYIPDAYLSFAEFFFNQGDVEKALRLYEQVGKYPDSPIYGYAVYKQGWCWLNLKEPKKALALFVKVIRNVHKWGGTKKGKIILVKEAKKDAVRAYAQVAGPDKAWPFFKRIGGDYAMTMLERLADLYYGQGKYLFAAHVYRQLIALNPKSAKLCDWQYNVMRCTLSGKSKRDQVVEVKRLAAVYTALKKRKDVKKTRLTECRENAAGILRELATTWHREAQKTQNRDTYALAEYLYREYLERFPEEKDAYEMSFYYAELLFKLERWASAAEAYTRVVKMNPKGHYLKEAAYAAVISWKNQLNVGLEIRDTARGGGKGDRTKPRPLSDAQKKMIAAFDTYIKYVPNSPELTSIMYRKARIYYEHNHFERAVKLFGELATRFPKHELAVYSANLLLDSLNILKKYVELEKWVDRFLGMPDLAQGEFLAQLRKLKSGIQRKQAEQLQATARYRECGEKYAAIANEYQEDPKWPELVYNAAICFEAAKLIGLAISYRATLIRIAPKHLLAKKALYMIGANFHALAWYSRAAEYYEKFAKQYPGEKEAPQALQDAIVFRLGRAEYDKAIADARFFANKYGTRRKYASRTAAVIYSLGNIFEQRGETDKLIKHYKSYLKKWGKRGGADRQVLAHVKIGTTLWRRSCPTAGVNGACIKVVRVRSKRKIKHRRRRRGRKKKTIEIRKQCGPETKSKVVVLTRDKRRAAEARKNFASALKLFKRYGKKKIKARNDEERARRTQDLRYAAAAARFYQAERMFEEFLGVKFPKNLDFSAPTATNKRKRKKQQKRLEKSKKAFAKYLKTKGEKLARTRNAYQDVIKFKVAHWAIAASARIGQLFQNFADALYTAPVPKPPVPKALKRKEDIEDFIMTFTDSYCDTLEDKAQPLEAKAVQGLSTCLKKSTELSWYNEWSRLCEAELNQIKPAEYPLAAEIRARPGYLSVKPARASIVDRVD